MVEIVSRHGGQDLKSIFGKKWRLSTAESDESID